MAIYFGQSIAEKVLQADAYYAEGNHIRALDWAECSANGQKAGLAQAEREINLYIGMDLEEQFDTTDLPATWNKNFRPDYAVFEQALFILDNTARTRDASGVEMIESEKYQQEERNQGVGMSPQATRFLTITRSQTTRG